MKEFTTQREPAMSLESSFSEVLSSICKSDDEALAALQVTLQFPLQEFILAMGFFLVLVMEQITPAYKEQSVLPPREETRALLGTVNGRPQH
ncbi:Zinc transporter ZIP1 [Myotis brandtii]|uniref:Zinc transporter ZIP1 n=1 Tax=Myotis brandtii TaxID=109478 RepID=S7Q933_MYOBR|nr:Zinc transporter ZIP1 [Myotis brandtii]